VRSLSVWTIYWTIYIYGLIGGTVPVLAQQPDPVVLLPRTPARMPIVASSSLSSPNPAQTDRSQKYPASIPSPTAALVSPLPRPSSQSLAEPTPPLVAKKKDGVGNLRNELEPEVDGSRFQFIPLLTNAKKKDKNNEDLQPFEEAIANTEKLSGLFTLYRQQDTGKLYLEIQPDQLNRNFLGIATLESGLGDLGLYSGWPIRDFLFQFRRVHNQVHFVIPNVYFQVEPDDPQQRSLERSFSDSLLYTLDIHSIHSGRKSLLIDLSDLLLGERDLAGIAQALPQPIGDAYLPDPEKSYFSQTKTFPLNVEVEVSKGFVGDGSSRVVPDTLPDSRGFSLRIRYSFSALPDNDYRPRLADDRVGYFVTAYQNLSDRYRHEPFVRYISRWQLEKKDPGLPLSLPKEPIVFWIDNAVPLEYRDAIREGTLMWNAAFEQAGFEQAIEVRQMPNNAKWDPADVRYNTIRWTNSFGSPIVGLGPSRVNPLTGQILDADIILDSSAIARVLQRNYSTLATDNPTPTPATQWSIVDLHRCGYGQRLPYLQPLALQQISPEHLRRGRRTEIRSLPARTQQQYDDRCFGLGATAQAAMGALSLSVLQNASSHSPVMRTYVHQFLRHLTAHEVGHTLGLRHNFRSSTLLRPEELHNREITRNQGLSSSVMDYIPINLAPPGMPQGDYFSTAVGAYDRWVIEYGYKPIAANNPQEEWRQLQAIAQRASEPELSFSPDEDASNFLDPKAVVWDLSSDSLQFSQWQMENARRLWSRLDQRYPLPGGSYSELRDGFNVVFAHYARNALNATRYIGGQRFNRAHRGDPGGRLPFEPIPIAKQRQALAMLQQYLFAEDAFDFPPELLNQLAPSRWFHWGSYPAFYRLEYPIYNRILFLQSVVLSDLLSADRLARLRDAELKNRPGEMLTLPELFDTLQNDIWTELLQRQPTIQISALRRGLQHQYTNTLINMTLRNPDAIENATNLPELVLALETANAPEDARVLARYHLVQLQDAIAITLLQSYTLDTLTRAHLEAIQDRINKALNAPLRSQ